MNDAGHDVIVVGAGNAALCAAISAAEAGAKVLVLEKAPKERRGGNSTFAGGGLRFAYSGIGEVFEFLPDLSQAEREALEVDGYTVDDFNNDVMLSTEGFADPEQAETMTTQSNSTIRWLTSAGVKWEPRRFASRNGKTVLALGIPLQVKGGGLGLIDFEMRYAETLGVKFLYETKMTELLVDKGRVIGVRAKKRSDLDELHASAVVLACGGFEANPEMRVKYLGPGWDLVKVRGSRYNTGDGIKAALAVGAQAAGHWSGCHCSVIAAGAPPVESGVEANMFSFVYGIMVNDAGQRFMDEGENYFFHVYVKAATEITRQPHSIAYQIFDQKVKYLHRPTYSRHKRVEANSFEELADRLGIDRSVFRNTVETYNSSVSESVQFDPATKDGKCTLGISPPKSNWAQRIDSPPYLAYPVTAAITFSYGGLKTDAQTRVVDCEGNVIGGLYAVGELAGGLFYFNYPGACGLTKGAVFGRIAGVNAAKERSI